MVLRYWYLLRGSWPRIAELAYWPTVQMLLWGFLSKFMATNSSWVAQGVGVFLGAVMLWDVFFRGQLGVSISFLEEMWSRNMGHLFASPLRPYEWVGALFAMSMIRTLIGTIPAALLAIPIFGYSVFEMGWPLLAFFASLLVMGWWLALIVISLILRYGMGAEGLAWMAVFIMAPVSAVYYPVTVLPTWLQSVSWALPTTYVFEGMRAVLFGDGFQPNLFLGAVMLNLLYISIGTLVFMWSFRDARNRGSLFQNE